MTERIQKVLARAGMGSRRQCEQMIRDQRVRVDGIVASLGERVDISRVELTLDGIPVRVPEEKTYIKLYKPRGFLSSRRSQGGRPTIFELVSLPQRLFTAGRLDLDSEGLMLLTDDGELTQRLTHPSFEHQKEYRVQFTIPPTPDVIMKWKRGVQLPDGYRTKPGEIVVEAGSENGSWCRVILTEGRKRQIREMALVLGLSVERLIRIRIGTLEMGDIEPGTWRKCEPPEIERFRRDVL